MPCEEVNPTRKNSEDSDNKELCESGCGDNNRDSIFLTLFTMIRLVNRIAKRKRFDQELPSG